jgi:hypothetical protein
MAYMILASLGHAEFEKSPIFMAFSGDYSKLCPIHRACGGLARLAGERNPDFSTVAGAL